MAKITAPVKGFSGKVVGVQFADQVAETDNEGAIAYFTRHGYTVEGAPEGKTAKDAKVVEVPEGDPTDEWTNDQIKAYAKANDIDLGGASKKDEMLAVILVG